VLELIASSGEIKTILKKASVPMQLAAAIAERIVAFEKRRRRKLEANPSSLGAV
jgi:hypothetical protein